MKESLWDLVPGLLLIVLGILQSIFAIGLLSFGNIEDLPLLFTSIALLLLGVFWPKLLDRSGKDQMPKFRHALIIILISWCLIITPGLFFADLFSLTTGGIFVFLPMTIILLGLSYFSGRHDQGWLKRLSQAGMILSIISMFVLFVLLFFGHVGYHF